MARVQITLEIGGNVVDVADVEMPDVVLVAAVDAMAVKHGYRETIANPDFDASQAESEKNPREIVNPMTKWRHFAWRLRLHAQDVAREEFIRQGQMMANTQANSLFDSFIAEVKVKE